MIMAYKPLTSGFSFGLTSGVITTLGLLVGLEAGTGSRTAVLAGILTIAVADALSDSLGMHMAEESKGGEHNRDIWQATFATLLAKFFIALTFVVPVLIFSMQTAIIASIIWGFLLIISLTFYLSWRQHKSIWEPILEHLFISIIVVIATYYIGHWISTIYF